MSYKRCHMTFVQVAEHNPPIKNKRGMRTLFSCHGLHLRLPGIKLLVSLTYPLKITKGQTTQHPETSQNLLLIDIRHNVRLSGWHLKLKRLNLLLKGGITATLSSSSWSCCSLACSRCITMWVRSSTSS
jgi:hypothetical protein